MLGLQTNGFVTRAVIIVFSAALLSASVSISWAQGRADTLRLSLQQSVDRALEQGEEASLAQSELSTARARYLVARASVLPHIELNSSYTQQLESIYQGTTGGTAFDPDTTLSLEERVRNLEKELPNAGFYSIGQLFANSSFASKHSYIATLSASQKIFQGGYLWNSIAGARHALKGAAARRDDGLEDVRLAVRVAYLDALWSEREVEIANLSLSQAESQLRSVSLRQEAGGVSEFERLRAEVGRDNQLPAVQSARNEREQRLLDLKRLVNLPAEQPLVLTSALLDSAALPPEATAIDTTGWVEWSYDSPAIRALEQEVEANRHLVSITGSERWPELSAFASLSQQAYPRDITPASDDWRRDARAGLSLHWNLFDGLETKGNIQQAKVERRRAEIDLARAKESVRQSVVQQRGELLRAAADLRARSMTLSVARRAYQLAQLRYDEGASSLIELEDTRRDLDIAARNEARSRHDFLVALARLERFTGRPIFTGVATRGD